MLLGRDRAVAVPVEDLEGGLANVSLDVQSFVHSCGNELCVRDLATILGHDAEQPIRILATNLREAITKLLLGEHAVPVRIQGEKDLRKLLQLFLGHVQCDDLQSRLLEKISLP